MLHACHTANVFRDLQVNMEETRLDKGPQLWVGFFFFFNNHIGFRSQNSREITHALSDARSLMGVFSGLGGEPVCSALCF